MTRTGSASAALVVLALGAFIADARQDNYRSGSIYTKTGILLVWNEPNNWFTIEIKGTEVRATSTTRRVFTVDGLFLQIVTANANKFVGDRERQATSDKTILEAHRDWEAKYSESSYHEKLEVESSWQKLASGKDALLWKFNVPASAKTNVKREIFLTLVKGDFVLMLGTVVTDEIKEDACLKLLLNTASSLKASDKPIDFQQLQETIRKGG